MWWGRAAQALVQAMRAQVSGVSSPTNDWKPPPPPHNAISHVEQLMLLTDLRDAGFMSDEDAAAEKRKVLGP
jgi:hypothetical protein